VQHRKWEDFGDFRLKPESALPLGVNPSGLRRAKALVCQLTIARRAGNAWGKPEQLIAGQRAAFEILTDAPDERVPVRV